MIAINFHFLYVLILFPFSSHCISEELSFVTDHLGTKTPYRFVDSSDEEIEIHQGCHPLKIIGIIRHGTRTPGHKNVKQIKEILSLVKNDFIQNERARLLHIFLNVTGAVPFGRFCGTLPANGKSLIRNWELHMDTEGSKYLTKEGESEMCLFGRRLSKRFPSVFAHYQNDSFLFKFTKTQRTEESAKNFARGIFGDIDVWFPEPEDPDTLLRFYKVCKKWREEVKNNPKSTHERKLFSQSKEMQRALEEISSRLGLTYCITFGTAMAMYNLCAFETAWFPDETSAWCTPLSESNIKTLEYAEELKYYWRDGYGFNINYKQSCPLFANIMSFLEGNIDQSRSAVFYFTHSGTILKSLSWLQLHKDDFLLKADLDSESREKRHWRVSHIDTFGSNIVFTLYECEEGKMVLVTHQERQVWLPGCPPLPLLCPLSNLKNLLPEDSACDLKEICSVRG